MRVTGAKRRMAHCAIRAVIGRTILGWLGCFSYPWQGHSALCDLTCSESSCHTSGNLASSSRGSGQLSANDPSSSHRQLTPRASPR